MNQIITPPFSFGVDAPHAYDSPAQAIDKRHVYLLRDLLGICRPNLPLEIGCFNGASTAAFLDYAKNYPTRLTLCDVRFSGHVREMVRRFVSMGEDLGRSFVQMEERDSLEVFASFVPFDFILFDGRHDFEQVHAEFLSSLHDNGPDFIACHDTSASLAGYPKAEGSEWLKRQLMFSEGWYCIEDNIAREGEETQRGFFFATRDQHLYRNAQGCFRRWCCRWQPVPHESKELACT